MVVGYTVSRSPAQGRANSNADALSRNLVDQAPDEGIGETGLQVAVISSTPPDTISDLLQKLPGMAHGEPFVTEQLKDRVLADTISYLWHHQLPEDPECSQRVISQSPLFTLVGGVLCFTGKGSAPRPVMPKHLH
jgi:hypothetical protein